METLKDRLRAFDVHFPCRCEEKGHVKASLNLYMAWYNHVRTHQALGRPPLPTEVETEWARFQNLVKEAIRP